ncbi:hypothetical protein T07_5598 [Trichinella nelsoni]|uniref:Uncharacterized protein n=1 Tax=Trichinella nelsoni TaxID=6336 RepID=A0A0V0RZM3_9BILA|nr:hypothetical protein T07_5598 [Trichinella nelsoni]
MGTEVGPSGSIPLPSTSAESERSEMRNRYIHVVATMKKVKMLLATASLKLHVSPAAVELLGRCAMCFVATLFSIFKEE